LDHLPQVGGGFGSSTTVGEGLATVYRRAPVSADYLDFINYALPLLNGHQGLRVPPTWSSGLGHRKGTKSSKLPGSAHFVLSTWSGRLGHQKGKESSKLPDLSPLFCAINPDNLSGIEPFLR
jgi:hypothetical protein